jgi:hypothetical protein
MNAKLASVPLPKLDTIQVTVDPPNRVRMSGTITLRDPSKDLAGFYRGLHQAAIEDGVKELCMDVTGLTFVNSSAIRLFADWTTWLKNTPPTERYVLKFRTSPKLTWQKACFSALLVIAKDVLAVEDA